jgi:hypothetical protein
MRDVRGKLMLGLLGFLDVFSQFIELGFTVLEQAFSVPERFSSVPLILFGLAGSFQVFQRFLQGFEL